LDTPVGLFQRRVIEVWYSRWVLDVGCHNLFVLQLAFHPAALQLQVHGPVHDTAVAVHEAHSSAHDGAFTLVLPYAVQQDQIIFATQVLPDLVYPGLQVQSHATVLLQLFTSVHIWLGVVGVPPSLHTVLFAVGAVAEHELATHISPLKL
jgi:hypothetical protein